jgi:hypothetical protein
MSQASAPEAWQCDRCGDVHDNEDDARECCAPEIIEGYLCPLCRDFHECEEAAFDCCGWDPDMPIPPTAIELEAAGQMRLIP